MIFITGIAGSLLMRPALEKTVNLFDEVSKSVVVNKFVGLHGLNEGGMCLLFSCACRLYFKK